MRKISSVFTTHLCLLEMSLWVFAPPLNRTLSQLESVFLPGRAAVSGGADVLSKVACLC